MERYINPPIQGPGTGIGPTSTTPPMVFFEDFLGGANIGPPGAGTAVGNVGSIWEIGVYDGGTVSMTNDRHGGWLGITTSTTDNHDLQIQTNVESWLPADSKGFYLETRLRASQVALGPHSFFVGLFTRDTVFGTDAAVTAFDHMGVDTQESVNISQMVGDGTAATTSTVDTGSDLALNTNVTIALEYSPSSDTFKTYVDGDLKATTTGASQYLPSGECCLGILTRNAAGSAATSFEFDYIYLTMDR